jgi:hypothetical protein
MGFRGRGRKTDRLADYRVRFERGIGDRVDVEPMVFEDVADPDELSSLIYERGRAYLPPNDEAVEMDLDDVEVVVDLERMSGAFYAPVGRFKIERKRSGS